MQTKMYENLSSISQFVKIAAQITLAQYSIMTLVNIFIYFTKVHKLEQKGFFLPILSLLQINYTALIIAWAKII